MNNKNTPQVHPAMEEAASRIGANKSFQASDFPNLHDWLKGHWRVAVGEVFSLSASSDQWFERLFQQHTEPTRHYHTVVHLKEMLEYIQALEAESNSISVLQFGGGVHHRTNDDNDAARRILRLATFFHDAIYDPKGTQNELKSAQLFQEFCKDVPRTINPTTIMTMEDEESNIQNAVRILILATEQHQVVTTTMDESSSSFSPLDDTIINLQKLFLDIDMAVLGKSPDAYLAYAALIRKEYAHHVPRDVYCDKRAEILEGFCCQGRRIFVSEPFYTILERKAKENLRTEIQLLKRGVIPGEQEAR
jgi:predicted metal-dependent HD superfamily phosphohydrolase